MNDFTSRWRALARRARRADAHLVTPPAGFATRIVARAYAAKAPSAEEWGFRLALRSLAGILALVLVLALLELPHWRPRTVLDPKIENTVAQLLWSL